jgi:hypothetical protein
MTEDKAADVMKGASEIQNGMGAHAARPSVAIIGGDGVLPHTGAVQFSAAGLRAKPRDYPLTY